MFKNAKVFNIAMPKDLASSALSDAAQAAGFEPCGPTQERSVGWVPPRGEEHGAMVERIGDATLMRVMIETKAVPAQAIKDAVEAQADIIEHNTGRKPGKKERREMADDVRLQLLPLAFPKRVAVMVWIDAAGILVIDTASQSRADEVVTQIVRLADDIKVTMPSFSVSPGSIMTTWLYDGDNLSDFDRFGFGIGRACELRASDETKAVVRYTRHYLDTDEVKQHITQGKVATKLALTYADRVEFTLTDGGTLAGISVLDVVLEASDPEQVADHFDADVAIMTGELKPLIESLFEALDVQDDEVVA